MSRDNKRVLAGAVSDAVAAGLVATDDRMAVAEVLWAAAHGTVSLEQTGHLAEGVAAERHDHPAHGLAPPVPGVSGGGGGPG